MILCVSPNAAIDKTAIVSPFRLNQIHRPQQVLALPGGKGCNVARALKRLGESPVVTGWVGGFAGQFIEAGLRHEGIETAFVQTDFESRTCLSILDPENNTLTELYENGAPIPADRLDALIEQVRALAGQCEVITLSGSLPAGVPTDFYAQLIEIAHGAGKRVFLDASGEALKRGLDAKPFLIKPNRKEFSDLIGRELPDVAAYAQAASEVAAHSGTTVVLSLGADGAIAANAQDVCHIKPPTLKVTSPVGSGDSLLAGVTYGLLRGYSLVDALRYGVAAGTANALNIGAGIFSAADFERVYEGVTVVPC